MTPKIFPRGSKVKLGGRDPPKKFFSKSEDVGEIMQNYYKSDTNKKMNFLKVKLIKTWI